jgi:hypothetical protein
VDKWLKLNELIYKIPNLFVRGVEDMRSVLVNEDVALVFAVAVAARMATAVYYKHPLTRLMGTISRYGTIQSGTDNQQIIFECRIQNAKCYAFAKLKIKN